MKRNVGNRIMATVLVIMMGVLLLSGCGEKNSGSKKNQFSWWIYRTDSDGQYYETYEESPVAQWLKEQYWDVEKGGIGNKENGTQLDISYVVPITGSEMDNFNTMMATGEYPEIVDLVVSTESPIALHDAGMLMEITEYVEKYMPNYLAFLDENPKWKPTVQVTDEDGKIHYYAIYAFADSVGQPWEGTCYRRDWIVKYAEPTKYVWDWESEYVKTNSHPAVTPLDKAISEGNLEGWKVNEVTQFISDYGENPNETYTDNVIFPSGTANPLTISDWEWMFKAFDKALEERGWSEDSGAYGFSIASTGFFGMGDVVSSFGGGNGTFYAKDGEVAFDGDSENFKTYVECMQTWYEKGWLDSSFNERAGDMFFQINSAGVSQGKVGMWCGMTSTLGTAIRTSCTDPTGADQKDAYVMGCALPLNDVYGNEDQKFVEPDALYQDGGLGTPVGFTPKAKEKDLAALFTFIDWTYTVEGAKTIRFGLNEEQYKSVTLKPDLFAEYNITGAYTETVDEEGKTVYNRVVDSSNTLSSALTGQRMDVGRKLFGTNGEYTIEEGAAEVNKRAYEEWTKYISTGNILDYTKLLNAKETEKYRKISTACMDYQSTNLPDVIKGKMSWEDYVSGLEKINPDSVLEYLQKYVDMAKTVEK